LRGLWGEKIHDKEQQQQQQQAFLVSKMHRMAGI
jgi:hypothetical protein